MIDPHVADPKLTDAFRALSDTSDADCSEEMRERIWRAVTGELPAAERQDVVELTAADPSCAEAWRIATEVWRASGAADRAEPLGDVARAPLMRFWTPSWLAAAAALILTTTIGVVSLVNRPPADVYRATRSYVVQSLVPSDATLPRGAFRLQWTAGPEGSRYEVRVTTDDLHMLTTVSDLTAPELLVAPVQLEGVVAGARVFWQVEASLPDGERVASRTFVTRIE